jgi:hypothetical protein
VRWNPRGSVVVAITSQRVFGAIASKHGRRCTYVGEPRLPNLRVAAGRASPRQIQSLVRSVWLKCKKKIGRVMQDVGRFITI